MTINFKTPEIRELQPRLLVMGVGGAGGNAINEMIENGMQGVEFIAVNTDAQDLKHSKAKSKIQIGLNLTKGLGAGAKIDIGQAAADESLNDIINVLQGANMVFIAAGMGGGTGTGAAHVIARAAKELNILTVGVVTLPFLYEGPSRMRRAQIGLEELRKHVDTIIVIPNQNLFKIANEQTTFEESFNLSNNVLMHGVQSVTDLMVKPGIMNHDYSDVRAVMSETGKVHLGTGIAEGDESRFTKQVESFGYKNIVYALEVHEKYWGYYIDGERKYYTCKVLTRISNNLLKKQYARTIERLNGIPKSTKEAMKKETKKVNQMLNKLNY